MTGVEIAALASAALSAGTGVASAASAGKANKRGVAFAKEENAAQRKNQWEMWHSNNIFNSPIEQMKRLKEAGINPHYYFGGNSGNNQAVPVQASPGGVSPNIRPVDFSPIAQSAQTMLQAEMMKAQIDNIKAQTNKTNEEIESVELANGITTEVLKNTPTDIDLNNQIKRANIEITKEQIELTSAKVESEKQQLINSISTNEEIKQRIDNLIVQKQYTEQQTANLVASMALTQSQIKTEAVKRVNISADTNLKNKESQLKEEQTKTQSFIRSNLTANTQYLNANAKNLGKQYDILEEQRKEYNRKNFLGEKYDMSDRSNSMTTSEEQIRVIKQTYRNLMKDEKFKELKIEEQQYINMNLGVDTALRPLKEQMNNSRIDLENETRRLNNENTQRRNRNLDNTSSTTRSYDSRGRQTGSRTTTRHR